MGAVRRGQHERAHLAVERVLRPVRHDGGLDAPSTLDGRHDDLALRRRAIRLDVDALRVVDAAVALVGALYRGLGDTIESFFAPFKNSVCGAHQWVSAKYLPNYLDEYAFRWNHRKDERAMFWAILERAQKDRLSAA